MQSKQAKQVLIGGLAVACLLAAAAWVGHTTGQSTAQRALLQLQTLWPDFLHMREADKIVVVRAAYACHLGGENAGDSRANTISCLRRGAADLDTREPGKNMRGQLENLLGTSTISK